MKKRLRCVDKLVGELDRYIDRMSQAGQDAESITLSSEQWRAVVECQAKHADRPSQVDAIEKELANETYRGLSLKLFR